MSEGTDFGGFDFSQAEGADNSDVVDNSAPVGTENQDSPNENGGVNPAWNPVLESIPAEFHNVLTPHFKEWDSNYQKGLEKARSEVQAQYDPYKPFIENQVDPQQIQQSLELFQILENDPQRVYEALHEQFGTEDFAQGQDDDDFSYDPGAVENSPQFQQLQANFNALAEQIQSQQEQQQEQQIYEEELNNIQSTVEDLAPKFQQQYGFEMDREQVLRIAIQNMEMTNSDLDIPGAAKEFADMVSRYRTPAPPPGQQTPNVLPTNGGIPQANFDVTKLDEDQRQELVAEMLRKAHEQ